MSEVKEKSMNEMDRKVCLRAAELVDQGHCKNRPAVDEHDFSVAPNDERAVAWCATGALVKAYSEMYAEDGYDPAIWESFRLRIQPAAIAARASMRLKTFDECTSVPEWNNKPRTTPIQVARFLRLLADSPTP